MSIEATLILIELLGRDGKVLELGRKVVGLEI